MQQMIDQCVQMMDSMMNNGMMMGSGMMGMMLFGTLIVLALVLTGVAGADISRPRRYN